MLITLGIIGVVAAITIPTLIQNYKKQQYVNMLKEGYSILNNGFKLMMSTEGIENFEDSELYAAVMNNGGDTDIVAAEQAAEAVISKYFQKVRLVSRADLIGKSTCKDLVGKGPRFWNLGDKSTCSGNYNMNFALPNGMTMGIWLSPGSEYSLKEEEIKAKGGKLWKCFGMIDLDINGEKLPNQWGRDGFRFYITQSGTIIPFSGRDTLIANGYDPARVSYPGCRERDSASQRHGRTCAARIIEEDNWQMKY